MIRSWIIGSSMLIIITLLTRFLFRNRISKRMRYILWLPVLIRLIVPFSLWHYQGGYLPGSFFQMNSSQAEPAEIGHDDEVQEELNQAEEKASLSNSDDLTGGSDRKSRSVSGRNTSSKLPEEAKLAFRKTTAFLLNHLWLFWICGSLFLTLWFLAVRLHLSARLKRNRILSDEYTVGGRIPVYLTDAVGTPCLFGLAAPAVYMPLRKTDNQNSLQYALEHEICHYRQKDHIWSALRIVCLVIWWWNPLVWLAAALSRADSELACDELALGRLGWENRFSYAEALLSIASESRLKRYSLFLTGTVSGKREMKRRLMTMMRKTGKSSFCTGLCAVLIISGILLCFAGEVEKKTDEYKIPQTLAGRESEVLDYLLNALSISDTNVKAAASGEDPAAGRFALLWWLDAMDRCHRIEKAAEVEGVLDNSWQEKATDYREVLSSLEAADEQFDLPGVIRVLTQLPYGLDIPSVESALNTIHAAFLFDSTQLNGREDSIVYKRYYTCADSDDQIYLLCLLFMKGSTMDKYLQVLDPEAHVDEEWILSDAWMIPYGYKDADELASAVTSCCPEIQSVSTSETMPQNGTILTYTIYADELFMDPFIYTQYRKVAAEAGNKLLDGLLWIYKYIRLTSPGNSSGEEAAVWGESDSLVVSVDPWFPCYFQAVYQKWGNYIPPEINPEVNTERDEVYLKIYDGCFNTWHALVDVITERTDVEHGSAVMLEKYNDINGWEVIADGDKLSAMCTLSARRRVEAVDISWGTKLESGQYRLTVMLNIGDEEKNYTVEFILE